jgi:hypothetical protein
MHMRYLNSLAVADLAGFIHDATGNLQAGARLASHSEKRGLMFVRGEKGRLGPLSSETGSSMANSTFAS